MTVSGDTFKTDAVSSTLSPPKNRSSTTRLFRSSKFASASSASSSATKSCAGLVGDRQRLVEGHPRRIAAALLSAPRTRVVDEDAPHHASGHREESARGRATPRPCASTSRTIRLVDERRRLEAVSRALARHAATRDLVELLMDERNQPLEGSLVALSPFKEQPGDLGAVR